MLALRSAPEVKIDQGNPRLPHRMLKISETDMHLNTYVSRITTGENRRWRVHTLPTTRAEQPLSTCETEFDIVILTAPFAFNDIDIEPPPLILASINRSAAVYGKTRDSLLHAPPPLSHILQLMPQHHRPRKHPHSARETRLREPQRRLQHHRR
jgi:hypothetical protein